MSYVFGYGKLMGNVELRKFLKGRAYFLLNTYLIDYKMKRV